MASVGTASGAAIVAGVAEFESGVQSGVGLSTGEAVVIGTAPDASVPTAASGTIVGSATVQGQSIPLFPTNNNYTIIQTVSANNYYLITVNVPQVFPFLIQRKLGGSIFIAQAAPGMQDGSLEAWISTTPLGTPLFGQFDWPNPIFVLRNHPKMITLYDQNMPNLPPGALALDPTMIYFLNIKNNQAKRNAFKLIITGELI
jgi:hypothetical protein